MTPSQGTLEFTEADFKQYMAWLEPYRKRVVEEKQPLTQEEYPRVQAIGRELRKLYDRASLSQSPILPVYAEIEGAHQRMVREQRDNNLREEWWQIQEQSEELRTRGMMTPDLEQRCSLRARYIRSVIEPDHYSGKPFREMPEKVF